MRERNRWLMVGLHLNVTCWAFMGTKPAAFGLEIRMVPIARTGFRMFGKRIKMDPPLRGGRAYTGFECPVK